jgi:uncharacterized protein (DUF1697 family)
MYVYIALLRAVNVGGTGKLPMDELKSICARCGFRDVQTYIASGNVVLECDGSEAEVKKALESRLARHAGKPVGVMVRTPAEMAAVAKRNPFPGAPGNRTAAIFLDAAPPRDTLATITGRKDEEVVLGTREIYVLYGADMGRSKLRIPAAAAGTARNLNTVAKLAEMAGRRTA